VTDENSRLLLANPAARLVLGPAGKAAAPGEAIVLQKELIDLLQGLDSGKKSAEVTLPDGKIYYASASAVLADGRPVGRVCVLQDVTHFKELDALKSDFVSTVSHDLRSPLTLMRGYATMLSMVGKLNEQQKGYADKITSGVDNMAKLVDTLLDLGRLEAGVDLQVEEVRLREFAAGVTDILQLQAGQKKIRLAVESVEPLPDTIVADRALLQQALYNLIENAIKYTPDGGQVRLFVKAYPQAVQFEVRDNGIGIAAADQPRLFEKFFRGSQREARAQRGSGLGLSIVRSIAERHGGKVWLESQVGQGSTFHLLVPIRQPESPRKKK
jgi:signal transduction histidine kinase